MRKFVTIGIGSSLSLLLACGSNPAGDDNASSGIEGGTADEPGASVPGSSAHNRPTHRPPKHPPAESGG